uniref:Lipoprotein n=1 Tax=Archangium violaceum TaxID=83451 RepID=A0A3Q8I411_9BACT|nr:hypothetical protein [Archangium violaceum]
MRKTGMKLALLGGFAGVALLAGCGNNPYDYGRVWSLTAQEDYYPKQAQDQDAAAREHSNIGTSATLFETTEQERGTGGAGEAHARSGDNEQPAVQGREQGQENLWLKQDMRVPYPPPRLDAQVAMELGTGKPLQAVRGVWVQGIQSVELGSGRATSVSTAASSFAPQEQPGSASSLPNEPASEGQQAPKGQIGQPPAPDEQ